MLLYNNRNTIEIQRLREKYKIDIPRKDWVDGRFNDYSISLIHDMNEYGSGKHFKVLQKKLEEVVWEDDGKFEVLVNSLNEFLQKFS